MNLSMEMKKVDLQEQLDKLEKIFYELKESKITPEKTKRASVIIQETEKFFSDKGFEVSKSKDRIEFVYKNTLKVELSHLTPPIYVLVFQNEKDYTFEYEITDKFIGNQFIASGPDADIEILNKKIRSTKAAIEKLTAIDPSQLAGVFSVGYVPPNSHMRAKKSFNTFSEVLDFIFN